MKNRTVRHAPTKIAAFVAAATIATSMAQADIITYDIEWTNVSGTPAVAFGMVTIDTDLADANGDGVWSFVDPITAFSSMMVTIMGSAGDDGTYTSFAGEITDMIWFTTGPLDYHSELIGQGVVADFNFFGGIGSPTGIAPDTFITPFSGEVFELHSVTPVPAPSALALLGLASLATTRRRR